MVRRLFICIFFAVSLANIRPVQATDGTGETVVATVGDDPITAADVTRIMDAIPANKRPAGDLQPTAQAIAMEEVVNRWLIIAYAKRTGDEPSAEDLAAAKKKIRLRLAAQGIKVSNTPAANSITEAELERQATWRLIWDGYLAKYRTPEHRKTWFAAHHRELDGTQLVVSHILLRPAADAGPKDLEALEKQAASIRAEIASGAIDFAQAATKYSAGPSGKQGGRLGKIGRHGPMDEAFSLAAFSLDAGQVSPPIRTRFGVHLIRCDEVAPGTKQIAELKDAIDEALARDLLERISNFEREKSAVKYTDAWPHFKPGTHELAK